MNRLERSSEGVCLVIDTCTTNDKGEKHAGFYHIAKQCPGLEEDLTILIDGDKLGHLTSLTLRNGPSAINPWPINKATIRNKPGTKVIVEELNIIGLLHCKVEGTIDEWNVYQTGRYGIKVGKIGGGHGMDISVLDGGSIDISGVEYFGCFSGARLNGYNFPSTVKGLTIHNCYIRDTIGGEGFYIGSTQPQPYTRFTDVKIYNNYLVRTAGEAIQIQHVFGNVHIHNNQVFCADISWIKMFQENQSSALQWVVDGGDNIIEKMIIDGFCQGMICKGGDIPAPEDSISVVRDILFNDGFNGMYLHNTMKRGVAWCFDRLHFRNFTELFSITTGHKPVDHIISVPNGTDKVYFNELTYDNTVARMFEKMPDDGRAKQVSGVGDALKYHNPGWHEPAHSIREWHPYIAGYHPLSKSGTVKIPSEWKAGEVARSSNLEAKTLRFFKCVKDHSSTELRPEENSECFIELSWDKRGVRSDQHGFEGAFSIIPPDDFRVIGKWKEFGVPYREEIIDRYIIGRTEYTETEFDTYTRPI